MRRFKLATMIMILSLSLPCCNAQTDTKQKTSDSKAMSRIKTVQSGISDDNLANVSRDPLYFFKYTFLDYNKFTEIRDNNDLISYIAISYSSYVDTDYDSYWDERKMLSLDAGQPPLTLYMNQVQVYKGYLFKTIDDVTPPEGERIFTDFTPSQLDLIYDYISNPLENRQYFFSGDEYSGLTQPVETSTYYLEDGDYVFVLAIFEPNLSVNAWAISKCIDEPDAIWQGLIDIMEENFID